MKFDRHFDLTGKHATLSPSSYSWLNYADEQVVERVYTQLAAAHGTRLHEFAKEAIELGIKLPENEKTLNLYINDAIGWGLTPEQPLFYSQHIFGTADAIGFRERPNERPVLRISDLKTGTSPTSFKQLEIYTALFCLEYSIKPAELDIELRIYQTDECFLLIPEMHDIVFAMDRIITFDRLIRKTREEALS